VRRFIPSPALIVACLALVLASGGVSYAAAKITTRDIADSAITGSKIKDATIGAIDLGPSSRALMGVRAYADVTVDAVFDTTRTHGFANVTRPKTGVYCLTLTDPAIDPATTAPVVGVDWDNSSGANLAAYLSKSAHQCPEGADFGVRTFSFTAGANNKPSNIVSFTIVVP
jgi:hypothetical protein